MTDPTADPVKKALVIGDGSWGTTLALRLAKNGIDTVLWSAFPGAGGGDGRGGLERGVPCPASPFPSNLVASADPFGAAEGADLVVSVVPTQFVGQVALRFEDALPGGIPLVTASKGLEIETFRTPSQILRRILGERPGLRPHRPEPRRGGGP